MWWASVRRSSRGLSLRPFTQTNPGLSPSPCCPSSGQVFTPDLEEAAFHQGQDSALERGEKMSFDLFILTVPFFLRAPQIFSSGNCLMHLTDQLAHLQGSSRTALSLKLRCKALLVTSAGPRSLTAGGHSVSAPSAKTRGETRKPKRLSHSLPAPRGRGGGGEGSGPSRIIRALIV